MVRCRIGAGVPAVTLCRRMGARVIKLLECAYSILRTLRAWIKHVIALFQSVVFFALTHGHESQRISLGSARRRPVGVGVVVGSLLRRRGASH